MATNLSNQSYTEDQLKQVELLHDNLERYSKKQDDHYKDLITKVTFLFGFVVTILTLYGTYASSINPIMKWLAMLAFGITIILLSFAYQNYTYFDPPILDTKVNNWNYFSKLYQDVMNLKKVCIQNDDTLKSLENWVGRAVWVFTTGIILLVLSFLFSQGMIKFAYEQHHAATTTGTHTSGAHTTQKE